MADEAGADDVERRGDPAWQGSKIPNPAQDSNHQFPAYILRQERRHLPLFITLVVIINVVVLIITMGINNCPKNTGKEKCVANFLGRLSFQPLGENPLFGPSSQTLLKLGALDANKVIHEHQGWRLITCMWLHAGIVHLLANMLSVLVVGIRLEQESGYLKIAVIYLLSGFGGSLLSALFLQDQISVGASGALFGLLGAMLSELLTNWTIYTNKCAALSTLVLVVGVNLAVGILPHVDNFAHIGGFVTGFLSGFVLLVKPQYGWMSKAHLPSGYDTRFLAKTKHKGSQYALCIVAFMTLIAGLISVIVLVFHGVDGNKRCRWCHYLSCVPTSHWKCNDNAGVCNTYLLEDSLQLTCVSNNKTTTTSLSAPSSTLLSLCTQLCS